MHETILTKLFPPPPYLFFSSVGLDISDQSIKYAELKQHGSYLKLGRHGTMPIPPGVIFAGKIQDSGKLVSVLTELKKKERLSFVRVSLPEEQVYTFRLRVPQMPEKEIRNAVELQLEEHIPIKASEAVFDYAILETHDSGYDLQVSATAISFLESYLSVFTQAGLNALSFELEAQAITRAVIKTGDKGTVMIVDCGETRTGISIVNKGIVVFTTTLDFGGFGLTKAIEKSMNIPFAEAEKLKRTQGLNRKPENKELFSVLLQNISILRDEINKNLIYWQTHKDDEGREHTHVDEIILCGGNANLVGLAEYLTASLRMKVVLADPWSNVTLPNHDIPELPRRDALGYVTALGLTLGDREL